jgi:hypothetical protein
VEHLVGVRVAQVLERERQRGELARHPLGRELLAGGHHPVGRPLVQQAPVGPVGDRAVRLDGLLGRQPLGHEGEDDAVDEREGPRGGEAPHAQQREGVGVPLREGPVVLGDAMGPAPPATRRRRRNDELEHQQLGHRVEDGLLRGEVLVEGHALDAEHCAEVAHAQGLEAVGVDEVQRGAGDARGGERLALLPLRQGGSSDRDHGST